MTNRLGVSRAVGKAPSLVPASLESPLEAATYSSGTTAAEEAVAVFAPVHYEPNYAYPLIVWLHGPGDDENQLKRIMPLMSLRNYVGVAVRGTAPFAAGGRPGYCWAQSQPHVALAEQRIVDAMQFVQGRLNVAPRRIFLSGFDCGGTMALRLAFAHPRRFAGVLSLGGEFPVGGAPLARLSEARRLPVFLACGRESERYPSALVCDNLKLLHSAGIDLTLREYPGRHEIAPRMLEDMDRWIMEIVTGTVPRDGCGPRGAG